MESSEQVKNEFPPRLHNEVYPFIYPKKFKGSLQDKVAIITGTTPLSVSRLVIPGLT